MAIYPNGKNLTMFKGDTGQIKYTGLPTDKAYSIFWSIFDEDTNKIWVEIEAVFNQVTGEATVTITEEISNTLPVGEFTYALKGCFGGSKDTWIPETKLENGQYIQQPAPTITINDKRVEGN